MAKASRKQVPDKDVPLTTINIGKDQGSYMGKIDKETISIYCDCLNDKISIKEQQERMARSYAKLINEEHDKRRTLDHERT